MAYNAEGKCIVQIDPRYFRPTEVDSLLGDASRAREKLGWTPTIKFSDLVKEMVNQDLRLAEHDKFSLEHGFDTSQRSE